MLFCVLYAKIMAFWKKRERSVKILLGTTNPSKAQRFEALLRDYDVSFLTLRDLDISAVPEETGKTPVENAVQKAVCYGQFFDCVLCEDSGLYFRGLPLDDPRQPGLHIRSPRGRHLEDEEMIAYYAALVHSLGGRCRCAYVDGYAAYWHGAVRTFLDRKEDADFYMVDAVHPNRHPGWPLDSISVDLNTGLYFVEPNDSVQADVADATVRPCHARLTAFLAGAFRLQERRTV